MPFFTLTATDGDARIGTLHTPHGDVPTPAFMSVATQGSVKALDSSDLQNIGANIVLANTYHLYLRPGVDIVEDLGGLHGFMQWHGATLTDSGGFQGFSLEHLRKITEDAIIFRSHIDGSEHTFSPEAAIQHQEKIGADIIMPLDICAPADSDFDAVDSAVDKTNRWLLRCVEAHTRTDQRLFGIVQGGLFPELRRKSAEFITGVGFPGYSIGGLSVGEPKQAMYDTVNSQRRCCCLICLRSHPDGYMFDCVLPTRIARNGSLFVKTGRLNITAAFNKRKYAPIEEDCDCYTCRTFSAAYVHHLFRAKELLAYRLATIHNLRFILRLMEEMRAAIAAGEFAEYRREFHSRFTPPDEQTRRDQKQKWLASFGRA
ncbi:Queuine tRNA-ribosyltransferase [Geodia barretti]|uniref:Queuine tRNA-ribosyltransferase catalytic subunit 1 n=1 Tax=Geodia barretti TaxID=519541 RepID=A0AA35QUB2_GEOBA|nr:Queuine tRNA-ribosyltransferase [Geodia barretti]